MKTTLIVLALLCLETATALAVPLEAGVWEVKGSMALGNESSDGRYSGRRTEFLLSPSVQRYFHRRVAAGGEASLYISGKRQGFFSFGPIATHHFLESERIAPFFTLTPLGYSKREGTKGNLFTRAELGAKFFLTDAVAFNSAIRFTHRWAKESFGNQYADSFSLTAGFSVFL